MKLATGLFAVMIFAVTTLAQEPGENRFRRDARFSMDALIEIVNLDEAQIKELKATNRQFMETTRPLMQELAQIARSMREEMRSDDSDSVKIDGYRAQIQDLQKQINEIRSEYREMARGYLNPTQLEQLSILEEALALQKAANQALGLNLIEGGERQEMGMAGIGRGSRGQRARGRSKP